MKFRVEVGRGPGKNPFDFGGDPEFRFDLFPGSWIIFQDSLPLSDRV